MDRLVTIIGGSGFVGRYVARRFARAGWRVRVAVRRPNEAIFVRPYGTPGQVEPVFANIRDEASVRAAVRGAHAVVNCVGTFDRRGANNFEAVQAEGAARVARLAAAEGAARLVHISAIGADPAAPSIYGRSKAAGEAGVLAAFPEAVILRPSVIFGPEDGFFNRFGAMARLGPVLPIAGGATRFQPVYVDDVAQAVFNAVTGAAHGVFELGGPEAASFADLMRKMLGVIQRRRLVLNVPVFAMRPAAFLMDMVNAITLGLVPNNLITRDQLDSLTVDNVVSPAARGLTDLGVTPTAMDAVLPEYLWRYRPSGQYAAIKASAKNLKKT